MIIVKIIPLFGWNSYPWCDAVSLKNLSRPRKDWWNSCSSEAKLAWWNLILTKCIVINTEIRWTDFSTLGYFEVNPRIPSYLNNPFFCSSSLQVRKAMKRKRWHSQSFAFGLLPWQTMTQWNTTVMPLPHFHCISHTQFLLLKWYRSRYVWTIIMILSWVMIIGRLGGVIFKTSLKIALHVNWRCLFTLLKEYSKFTDLLI